MAPLDAPPRRSPTAAGSTPQEQSGSGAPMSAARSTGVTPAPPKSRPSAASGTQALTSPAATKPRSSHGAASR